MAGAGAKLFVSGDVLTAAQVNTYLMDQSVMRFADATARTNAFGGVGEPTLAEGMLSYLDDDNTVYVYDGSAWKAVGLGSTIDAKGDLLVGTADNTVGRLPVGINGYRVTAASGESTGLKYDMPSVPVFADTTARDNAFGGAGEKTLADGQMCYITAAPKRFQIYNGTVWKDFHVNYTDISSTQAFSGFTKGNGTIVSKYTRIGDFVHFYGRAILGSTSSMSTPLDVTLPITADENTFYFMSTCHLIDDATATYTGTTIQIGTTAQRLYLTTSSGTYTTVGDVSSNNPFAWATNDSFLWNIYYKAA